MAKISVSSFLKNVNSVLALNPKYEQPGDLRKQPPTMDCIGLPIESIRRAGGTYNGVHGSNWAARFEVSNFRPIKDTSDLIVGDVVFKAYKEDNPSYTLPAKYRKGGKNYTGDLNDYYHVGVVCSVEPLVIKHMTSPHYKTDTALGKWSYAGELNAVDYGDISIPVKEVETVDEEWKVSGGTLNLRMRPDQSSVRIIGIPDHTVIKVVEKTNDEWWKIEWGKHTGYVKAKFLEPVTGGTGLTLEERIERLEARVFAMENIIGKG